MHSSKTEAVGIFGGAFDPPHRGHVRALEAFLEKADLDRVYVIPSGKAPHKALSGEATDSDRLEMAGLAFSSVSPRVVVDDWEIRSDGISFTFRTVERIRKMHPEATLYLFIGTDQFLAFETWRNVAYLVKECILAVMARDGDEVALVEKKSCLEKEFGAQCLLLQEKAYIISSTEIRSDLEKEGFSEDLTPSVNGYLALRGLYGADGTLPRREALCRIRKALSEKRLLHSFSVEREVHRLCLLLGVSPEKRRELRVAALLHDLTKEKSPSEQIRLAEEHRVSFSSPDLLSPAVQHGITAFLLVRDALPEDCALAIRYHTTGRENMTLSEKILYLADYMEETRTYESCRRVRAQFYDDLPASLPQRLARLDACVLSTLEETVRFLKKRNMAVHPDSERALEYFKTRRKETE